MATSESSPRPRRALRRLIFALWAMAAVTGVLVALMITRARDAGDELPVMRQLPDFSLTQHDGSTVDLSTLAGKPFVADFIFTHCPGICPILSERMRALADELDAAGRTEAVNLVSVSVDPQRDTPEVLAAYAARHDAGPNWYFLTGSREDIHRLVVQGFQLMLDDSERQAAVAAASAGAGETGETGETGESADGDEATARDPADAGKEPIVHSNRFVLVDGQGRIRGYYNAFDAEELAELRRDLDRLL